MLDKTKEQIVLAHINAEWLEYQNLHFALNELKLKEGIASALPLYQKVIDFLYVYFTAHTEKDRLDSINAMMWIIGTFIKQVKL